MELNSGAPEGLVVPAPLVAPVVYGCSSVSICGATGSHVTGIDVSPVTGSDISHVSCSEVCSAHAQPEVVQYPP